MAAFPWEKGMVPEGLQPHVCEGLGERSCSLCKKGMVPAGLQPHLKVWGRTAGPLQFLGGCSHG